MADTVKFTEGLNYLISNGLPGTCYFLLSTQTCDQLGSGATLATGVGEITGTGYARQSQPEPTPANGVAAFAQMSWSTGAATNWPAVVCSLILVTVANNVGHAICAWNLVTGAGSRNLSVANTVEQVQPSMSLS